MAMISRLLAYVVAAAVAASPLGAQAGPASPLPRALRNALPARDSIIQVDTLIADAVLPGVRMIQITGFPCYDCGYHHATLAIRDADSLVIADLDGVERLWQFTASSESTDVGLARASLIQLLRITCLPGCGSRQVTSPSDFTDGDRAFLAPADSLDAVGPARDRSGPGQMETRFFVRDDAGVYRVNAAWNAGRLTLQVTTVAATRGP